LSPTDWKVFGLQAGIAGIVLAWFMLRLEGVLKSLTTSNDRLARAQLVLVLSLKQASEAAKDEARSGIREIDDSKNK
jgi:hypothetical protein